jgi:alpha-D-xyloside xylohydrolase
MMVAPLFAGEPERKVVLPAGNWHDFWTGEALEGGTELTVAAETEKIPVYVKAGSLVPWADAGLNVQDPAAHRLSVRVYGDGSLPWSHNDGYDTLHLSWSGGAGRAEGKSSYAVHAWNRIG